MRLDLTVPSLIARLTEREQRVLLLCLVTCDEETGEVPGGKAELVRTLGILEPENVRLALVSLENRALLRRGGQPVGTRIFVALSRFATGPLCEGCKTPLPQSTRGGAKWCAGCRQTLGREDRKWQAKAIRLWAEGKSPPEIHLALTRPLWRAPADDNQSSAIVPFLLAEGLLDDTWREALQRALEGGAER